MDRTPEEIKQDILSLVKEYYLRTHRDSGAFCPGKDPIRYAGRVYNEEELSLLTESALDFWLTEGHFAEEFNEKFSDYLGIHHSILTNSGSSANLLALSALTSPKLDNPLKAGDEVITVAAAFPTTVNPIIQNNLAPVFLDVELGTYNIDTDLLEDAISDKTKAIILAHTLGNPFDLGKVMEIKEKYDLYLIEDACDALGSRYGGKYVGTFGDIGTFSFYPAHHITMGEGGALVTYNAQFERIIRSFRDWGRDCWCKPGEDNTCGKRFGWQLGNLPYGYDHKYTYSHLGYNLKVTDMQAAVGVAQMEKLPSFVKTRQENFEKLYKRLERYEEFFILPQWQEKAEPSWFGFPLTVRKNAPFTRNEITEYLEKHNIATRNLFAGNILKHPAYIDSNIQYRVLGKLENTNRIMEASFWVGVYPGLTDKAIEYIIDSVQHFLNGAR